MDENYDALFERIRAKCRQQCWHGPSINNPFIAINRERMPRFIHFNSKATHYWYDHNMQQYATNLDTDPDRFPLQTHFEYPPATEEQVTLAEEDLGYSLPPLLRALYTTVANGGFGPGYGLAGIAIGNTTISTGLTRKSSHRAIDLAVYLRKYGSSAYFELPWYVWPDRLLNLCEWGCGYFSHLDCVSGRVFYGGAGKDGYGLSAQASSLEAWLNLWISGIDLERHTEGKEDE